MNFTHIKEAHKCETVEEVYTCLKKLDEDKQLLRSPEDVVQMEQKIMSYTNRLAALF